MAITHRAGLLALAAALAVGLLLPSWTGIALACLLVLVAVVVDLALAASVRGLRFERDGPTAVRLGEQVTVTLAVSNPGRRDLRALVRDAWPPSAGSSPATHFVAVPAGQRRVLSTTLRPARRGDRSAAQVTIRSFGPLRLAAWQASREVPWTVRALPAFASRKHLPSRLERLRELDGRNAMLVRGAGTEFDSLREYVIGDDVRAIDWRASARGADVMVRTWRPERDRHIVLVLDTGRVSAGRIGDAPRLDAAMDAALLLAALAAHAGDRVDLIAYDRRVRASVRGASATELLPSLVNAMAPLHPELVEFDARGMAGEVLRRTRRRSLVVLLTGLEAVEQGLLPVLPLLTTRHRMLLASVADPEVTRMARGRDDAQAVYAAAAAERTLSRRRQVTTLLGRYGVDVVDAVPAELPPALADQYLAVKAAGRL